MMHRLVRSFLVRVDVIDLCSSYAHSKSCEAAAAHDQYGLDHELEGAPSEAVEAVPLQLLLSASMGSHRSYHDERIAQTWRHGKLWVRTVN